MQKHGLNRQTGNVRTRQQLRRLNSWPNKQLHLCMCMCVCVCWYFFNICFVWFSILLSDFCFLLSAYRRSCQMVAYVVVGAAAFTFMFTLTFVGVQLRRSRRRRRRRRSRRVDASGRVFGRGFVRSVRFSTRDSTQRPSESRVFNSLNKKRNKI